MGLECLVTLGRCPCLLPAALARHAQLPRHGRVAADWHISFRPPNPNPSSCRCSCQPDILHTSAAAGERLSAEQSEEERTRLQAELTDAGEQIQRLQAQLTDEQRAHIDKVGMGAAAVVCALIGRLGAIRLLNPPAHARWPGGMHPAAAWRCRAHQRLGLSLHSSSSSRTLLLALAPSRLLQLRAAEVAAASLSWERGHRCRTEGELAAAGHASLEARMGAADLRRALEEEERWTSDKRAKIGRLEGERRQLEAALRLHAEQVRFVRCRRVGSAAAPALLHGWLCPSSAPCLASSQQEEEAQQQCRLLRTRVQQLETQARLAGTGSRPCALHGMSAECGRCTPRPASCREPAA